MTEPTDEMTLEEARQYAAARLHSWRHNDPARIPKELRCIRTLLHTADTRADDVVGELREWQPIETAPRNKTHVALLRLNEDGSRTYGHGYYMPLEGWRCWKHYAHRPPTHWTPLPLPPAALSRAALAEQEQK